MTIDRRLHRAAHELREVEISVPVFAPAAGPGVVRRAGPIAVAGLLALVGVGGVLAVDGGGVPQTVEPMAEAATVETPTVPPGTATPVENVSVVRAALTPRQEIAIIAALGTDDGEDLDTTEVDIPAGVS